MCDVLYGEAPRCVTKCDRGGGSKLVQNSVTYFMDGPLPYNNLSVGLMELFVIPQNNYKANTVPYLIKILNFAAVRKFLRTPISGHSNQCNMVYAYCLVCFLMCRYVGRCVEVSLRHSLRRSVATKWSTGSTD